MLRTALRPALDFHKPSAVLLAGGHAAEGFQISAIPYASSRDFPPSRSRFGRGILHIHNSLCLQPRFTFLQKVIWQRDSSYPRFPMPPAAICCPMGSYSACPLPTKSLRATECQGLAAPRCEAPLILQGSQIESPTGAGK